MHSVERLRRAVEEANAQPDNIPGAVLKTGDLLLGDAVYALGGSEECYLGDLLHNVRASELVYELKHVVQGHIDYLLGEESRSPIFLIRALAKLSGRDKGLAYEFLEELELIAKRAYEEDG